MNGLQMSRRGVTRLATNLGSSLSGLVTLDLSHGQYFYGTVTGNCAIQVVNALSSGFENQFMLELTNGGIYTVTWIGGSWPSAPTLSSAGTDVILGETRNAGAGVFYDMLAQNYAFPPQLDAAFNAMSWQTRLPANTTLSRASTASVYNSAGVLCIADTNVARLDWSYVTTNLLSYSQNLAVSPWALTGTASVVAKSAIAPDGSLTASQITSAVTNNGYAQPVTLVSGATYCFSIYLKTVSGAATVNVGCELAPTTAYITVNTSTGAITATGVAIVTSGTAASTNGYFRVYGTFVTTGTSCNMVAYAATSSSTVFNAWGAQLELGSTMNTYQPTQTQNLLTYTSQFANAAWTKTASTVAANSTTAPDGTLTATSLITANATSIQNITQSVTGQVANAPFTGSIYVKQGTWRYLQVLVDDGTNGAFVNIDTQTGTLGTVTATGAGTVGPATITASNNGFYRVTLASTSSGTTKRVIYGLSNSLTDTALQAAVGDGAKLLYVWGAQLEQASVASTYQPVLATPGVLMLAQGARAEQAATNQLPNSQDFTQASTWLLTNLTAAANVAGAPDGTDTLNTLTLANTTAAMYAARGTVLTASAPYTFSVYLGAGTWRYAQVVLDDGGSNGNYVNVDTQAGTWGSAGGASTIGVSAGSPTSAAFTLTAIGNGFYRASLSNVLVATNKRVIIFAVPALNSGYSASPTGGTGNYLYVWGAQLDLGSVATSYIPTTSASASRAADILTANVANGNYDVLIQDKTSAGWLYNQAASGGTGLVVYPRGGNGLTYSEQQDNAAWTKTAATVVANTMTAPDGNVTMDSLLTAAATSIQRTSQNYTGLASTTYTNSIFVKAGTWRYLQLVLDDGSANGYFVNIDTLNGVLGTVTMAGTATAGAATIYALPNGVFRVSLTASQAGTTKRTSIGLANSLTDTYLQNTVGGAGGAYAYLWGAQLDLGSVATAYTPTTSAAVAAQTTVARLRDFTAGALNAAQQATLKVAA